MEQLSPIDLLNAAFFLTFTGALVLSAVRIWFRLIRYMLAKRRIPLLLWRDASLTSGLAIPFGAILLVRTLRLIGIREELWWVLITGLPACAAMIIFAAFEYFVIDDRERAIVSTADQAEDRDFGDKRRALERQHISERAKSVNGLDPPESPST